MPRAPLSNIREEPNTEPTQSTNPKIKDAAPAATNPKQFSDGTPVLTAENATESNTETETNSKESPTNEPPNSEGTDKENIPPDSSDLPGYTLTEVDKIFDEVFGDHIHQKPGLHLDGGITDDATWQSYWRQLIEYPPSFYDTPNGALGKRIVEKIAEQLEGIMKRKWNAERLIVFQQVILQRGHGVNRARDIRRRITQKLDLWEKGEFQLLFESTHRDLQASLSKAQGTTTPEQRAKTYHAKVLRGNLRGAVRYITDREKGGILYPDDIDEKTGLPVSDSLRDKHPANRAVNPSDLPTYQSTPCLVPNVITEDTVLEVANKLLGSAGLGGMDSILLKHLLL
jgi:hypothetical protein